MTILPAPLEQRVQRLLESEGGFVVDNTPISIQEYRSFITDELAHGQLRQPDHWTSPIDSIGSENDPVTGVRPEDARSFCDWLTKKVSAKGQFRLPRQGEVGFAGQNEVAPWVTVDEKIVLSANAQLQQQWEQEVLDHIHGGFDLDLSCDFDLPLHRRVSKNTIRDAALERARNRNRNTALQQRLRERSTTLNRIWSVNPDGFIDAALRLQKVLRRLHKRSQNLSLYYELARDLDRAIREADNLSLIRAYLLCVHTTWDCCYMDVKASNQDAPLLAKLQQNVVSSFDLYVFVAMVDQRRKELLPCCESLQLAFEHTT